MTLKELCMIHAILFSSMIIVSPDTVILFIQRIVDKIDLIVVRLFFLLPLPLPFQ